MARSIPRWLSHSRSHPHGRVGSRRRKKKKKRNFPVSIVAIANLEIRTADSLAAKAELERQQEEEKLKLEDKVLHLLLNYEAAQRKQELLTSQLETLEQQREVVRIAYKYGRGSTSQILEMEKRRARLLKQLVEIEIKRNEKVRELVQLTKYVQEAP